MQRLVKRCRIGERRWSSTAIAATWALSSTLASRRPTGLRQSRETTPNNLVACQLAKVRFNVPLTTARINDPRNEDIFHKFGVDFALNSTNILATVIEEGIIVNDMIPLVSLGKGKATLVELKIAGESP